MTQKCLPNQHKNGLQYILLYTSNNNVQKHAHLLTAHISELATASCTFKQPLVFAFASASDASANGKTAEMYLQTSKSPAASKRIASGKGPQREPTKLISFTT